MNYHEKEKSYRALKVPIDDERTIYLTVETRIIYTILPKVCGHPSIHC